MVPGAPQPRVMQQQIPQPVVSEISNIDFERNAQKNRFSLLILLSDGSESACECDATTERKHAQRSGNEHGGICE